MLLQAILIECHGDSTTWGAVLERVDYEKLRAYYSQAASPAVRECEAILRDRFGELHCFNLGINQVCAQDLLSARWDARMDASPADIVTLNVGMNDARRGVPADEFVGALTALVAGATRAGKQVLVETPHPIARGHQPYGDSAVADRLELLVNTMVAALRSQGVPLCNHHGAVLQQAGWQSLVPDGVHGSPQLYAQKGRRLAESLQPLVREVAARRAA